jgi:phage terminase large subunit-like protein
MLEFRRASSRCPSRRRTSRRAWYAKKIRHGGNPVLAWNVGNAVIRKDPAGNIKPDKEKAKDKIDGVIAAIMAIGRAVLKDQSVYSGERGFLSL